MLNKGQSPVALRNSAFNIQHSALLLVLVLAKFGQHAEGRFRVQEGDTQAFGTSTWSLVDKADAQFLGFFEMAFDVLHGESDVVHATATVIVLDELGDGAFG